MTHNQRLLAFCLSFFVSFAGAEIASAMSAAPGVPKTPALEELPKLDLNLKRISVSGVSSGGFMAVQFHVAYSSLVKGAASIAGGIWECAKGDVQKSQGLCMTSPQNIVVSDYVELALARSKAKEIDDISNLSDARIAIFASPKDLVIKAAGSDKLEEFYKAFVPAPSITRLTNPSAGHGFPTLNFGNACGAFGTPWILKCNDDVAGKVLAATEPTNRTLASRTNSDSSAYIYFDQTILFGAAARMYPWGAAYIPKKCRAAGGGCGVHVALHGCQMNPDFIGQQFIESAGYNEWAEANDLVVLYPQSAKSNGNPYACWDWFGFTGPAYTTKSGVQIEAIRKLLFKLGVP